MGHSWQLAAQIPGTLGKEYNCRASPLLISRITKEGIPGFDFLGEAPQGRLNLHPS